VPWEKVKNRDERYGVETGKKKQARKEIEHVKVHEDADGCWKGSQHEDRRGNDHKPQ